MIFCNNIEKVTFLLKKNKDISLRKIKLLILRFYK